MFFESGASQAESSRDRRVSPPRRPRRSLPAEAIAKASSTHPVVRPAQRFLGILGRERSRADRVGDQMSLLVVFKKDLPKGWPSEQDLISLHDRLRCTDELGWIDDERLGILLPHTPEAQARRVGADLATRIPLTTESAFAVFSYPDAPRAPAPDARHQKEDNPAGADRGNEDSRPNPEFVLRMPLWKRCMDIVGASLGIVLLFPLFVLTALLVKLTSRGPIFFGQERAGLGGRPFRMWKFRSMIADADVLKERLRKHNEASGPVFKIEDDPRLTTVGRWIRKLSLDELPQLFNVLVGDMSLVGPRPPTLDEVSRYDRWQRRRLEITPGITCIWQVSGRCEIDFETWVRMDIEYGERRSFFYDLYLLLKTIPAVLFMRGAY